MGYQKIIPLQISNSIEWVSELLTGQWKTWIPWLSDGDGNGESMDLKEMFLTLLLLLINPKKTWDTFLTTILSQQRTRIWFSIIKSVVELRLWRWRWERWVWEIMEGKLQQNERERDKLEQKWWFNWMIGRGFDIMVSDKLRVSANLNNKKIKKF
jgi:hypothetical protein